MAQHSNPLSGAIGSQTRFVTGSTARVLGTLEQRKEQAKNMARLEGTGVDPRYGKGDIFDVPKYKPTAGDVDDREINPVYQELLDKKFAKEVDPKDDPGRTITQIADAKASRHDPLSDPVDAEIAASMTDAEALAIVHSGDPNAEATDDGKPGYVKEGQSEDWAQVQPAPAFMGQLMGDGTQAPAPEQEPESEQEPEGKGKGEGSGSSSSSSTGGSGKGSGSTAGSGSSSSS